MAERMLVTQALDEGDLLIKNSAVDETYGKDANTYVPWQNNYKYGFRGGIGSFEL